MPDLQVSSFNNSLLSGLLIHSIWRKCVRIITFSPHTCNVRRFLYCTFLTCISPVTGEAKAEESINLVNTSAPIFTRLRLAVINICVWERGRSSKSSANLISPEWEACALHRMKMWVFAAILRVAQEEEAFVVSYLCYSALITLIYHSLVAPLFVPILSERLLFFFVYQFTNDYTQQCYINHSHTFQQNSPHWPGQSPRFGRYLPHCGDNRNPRNYSPAVDHMHTPTCQRNKTTQKEHFSSQSIEYHFSVMSRGHVIFFSSLWGFWTQNKSFTPGLQKSINAHSQKKKPLKSSNFAWKSQIWTVSKQKEGSLKRSLASNAVRI